MGRHSSLEAAGAGPRVAWVAVIGAVVAAALIWFGVSRGLGDEDASGGGDDAAAASEAAATAFAEAMAATHEDHTAEPTDEAAATEEATATEEAAVTQAPTEEEAAGLPEAVAACVDQVAAGDTLAEAAAISAKNWKTHYTQTIKLNAGDIELEEATRFWAETKAEGPADMERFAGAKESYDGSLGGCDGVTADDAGDAVDAGDLEDCVQRSEALATIAGRGEAVNSDWDAHLEQMKVKADTDPEEYYEWWLEVVEAAPKNMDPYEDAVEALGEAPACTISR